jgi:integrase
MAVPKLCQNPDGRAYATIPKSGRKRVYFGEFGSDKAERQYRKWLEQILRVERTEAPLPVVTAGTSLDELILSYLDFAVTYYAADGKATAEYRNVCDAMGVLSKYAGEDLAASFGPTALRGVRSAMMRDGFTKGKDETRHRYSRGYVNSITNRIRRFFRWCESRELLPMGTAASLATLESLKAGKSHAIERPRVAAVDWKTVAATLPYCRPTLAAMIEVQFWSGMRPAEACRMRPRDIDTSGPVWLYTPPAHKTAHRGKVIVKAIPKRVHGVLSPFLAAADSESPIFLTRFKRPYSTDAYGTAIEAAIAKAKRAGVTVPHWSPNQLRHAIAQKVDALLGREAAQHWLSHSRPDVTAVYASRNDQILRQVAEALDRAE